MEVIDVFFSRRSEALSDCPWKLVNGGVPKVSTPLSKTLALWHYSMFGSTPLTCAFFKTMAQQFPYLYAVNDLVLFYRIYPRLSPIPIPLWNPRKLRFWRVLQFLSSKVSSMLHLLIVKLIQVTFSSMSDSLRTGLWRCGLSSSFLNQVSGNNNSNKKKNKNKNSWLSWSKKNMQKIYRKKKGFKSFRV